MLVFADNAWHIIAALLVFSIGLCLAIIQKPITNVPKKRAIALYFWHSFFCMFYFWYSLNNNADSTIYYLRSLDYDGGFKFGTQGIYFVVSFFTQGIHLSYGNVFLLFNILGYVGLLFFSSALQAVTIDSRKDIRKFSVLFLFLPGLSFWSSAIGKDAITFLAAGLVTWSALDFQRRLPAVVLGTLLFLAPRPHMAGVLLISICLALLISSRISIYKRTAILIAAIPICIAGVQFGLSYAGLDNPSGLSDISEYFEKRQGYNLGGGSSVDIASMPLPLRLFTYVFRPLLIDAKNSLGLIVSFENLLLLILFLAVVFRRTRSKSSLKRFELVFFNVFVLLSWFILANTTANLGIAIRQKTMFLPMLIVLLFSFWRREIKNYPTRVKNDG